MWQWDPPSERVRELIRRGAEIALRSPDEWLAEIDDVTLTTLGMSAIASDPVLAAATRRVNRANLAHWAEANIRDPGAPVPPNLGPEPLAAARDLVRRGINEAALHSYRTGQNAAWLRWMAIAFELTSDASELRELLDVTARSISAFIEATIAGITAQMAKERHELTRGTHAERREVVALLLEGAPIRPAHAEHRLGYPLDQAHRAAVIWSEDAESDMSALESVAEALARITGAPRFLGVVASAATLWVWLPGVAEPELDRVRAAMRDAPSARVAIGSLAKGVEGFRRSHLDALTAQRMLARLGSDARVVSFDRVRLVSLITIDPEGADHFVQHTLGDLATASPELRQTVEAFLEEGCNASRAAERLRVHRNTLLRRLETAEALMPRPLEHDRVHVGVALEVLRWRAGSER
ncbi:PucR family transcriptional regulator [Sandaracinus amylolyticus]|uniref:PucR family transcriptional regulator n=1 Tax=Sandaracinus amylolyticus TaxID=927083 RepID=UPI001F3559A2|nr:PucR family transcriptional regulator [Sandaracinus amylolyticus]UJR85158.1 Hypothetical protein I5071_72380 [Sandaracinus amylolyticus]